MSLRIAVVGAGAVGGYFGARLARAGHEVAFIARGPHLRAIRERGLLIWSPLGDLMIRARAECKPEAVGPVDLVVFAVKSYGVGPALALLPPLIGSETAILTLQNGVESPHQVAEAVGASRVIGGAAYVATALTLPGLIEQTGTTRRIVFGEVFEGRGTLTPRVARLADTLAASDIVAEPVEDAWGALWRKLIFLAPIAGLTGTSRLPVGPLRDAASFAGVFRAAASEVEAVARAEGVDPGPDPVGEALAYLTRMAPGVRSSLLIDLEQGKPIEIETLIGAVARKGRAAGVPTPLMDLLYAVLVPWEHGRPEGT